MLEGLVYWHWIVFGLVLFIFEILAPGAIFMWFGAGAVLVGGLIYLFPDISWQWQVLIFALVSLASLFAWRYFKQDNPEDNTESGTLNQRGKALIGRQVPLVEAISNGIGRVQIDDTYWRVEGSDLENGALVRVIASDGATLQVEKTD